MAIYDFNAALKPVESPIDQYGRLMQLKSLGNQQQIQQQQIQAGQLENQQRQMDMESQKAIMRAYTDANGDLDKAATLAGQYGAKPADLIKLRQAAIQTQEQNLQLLNAKGARALQEADWMKGAHDAVAQAPPEQKPQMYQQQLFGLQKLGVDVSQMPAQYPGDEMFNLLGAGVQGHKAQLEDLAKQTGIQKDVALTNQAVAGTEEKKATTAKTQLETLQLQQAGGTPAQQEARYRTILSRLAAKQQVPPEDIAFAKGYEASQAKATSTSDSLGIKSTNVSRPSGLASVGVGGAGGGGGRTSGGSGGGNLSAGGQNIVDMIGTGRMPVDRMAILLARDPRIPEAVAQKYPDFDGSRIKAYMDTFRDFTSSRNGTTGAQLTAGSVALQHLAQLKKINDDNPTEVRIPGTAANKAYNNLLDTVADELGTFYGEPKTNEVIAAKKATLGGLMNRDAAIREQAKAMGVRFDEFRQKWANAAPSAAYEAQMPDISPQGKAARALLDPSYKPQAAAPASGGFSVTDPSGGVHTFKSQAAAEAFKRAIGQ